MIEFIKKLAYDAGQICLNESSQVIKSQVIHKNAKDLVTHVDKQVEVYIIEQIRNRYPDHDILGEESGKISQGSPDCWIIDPIDGTTSFIHKQPFYSVSIAFSQNHTLHAAAVYAPVFNELFWAEKDGGAFLNSTPIRVSDSGTLIQSVLSTGFACLRAGHTHNNLNHFNRIVPKLRDIRRYGSAAMDLCYVACGRLDGFWEMNLNSYDIAAGVLIVTEAGGTVSDFQGGERFPENGTVATNGLIEKELLECLIPVS